MGVLAPSRARVVLRFVRLVGLIEFLGGLAALSAMTNLGRVPQTLDQWRVAISHMRCVFYGCVFTGVIILLVAGLATWWPRRREFNRQKWFWLMVGLLVACIPVLHMWGRQTAIQLYAAVDAEDLERASALWQQLGYAYLTALLVMLAIAAIPVCRGRR